MVGTLERLPVSNRRKVGTTSSHHGLYVQGCTRPTMRTYKRKRTSRGEANPEKRAAQFGLQAATRLHEAGIASNRRSAILR